MCASDLDGLLKLASLRGEVFKKSGPWVLFQPMVYSVLPMVERHCCANE